MDWTKPAGFLAGLVAAGITKKISKKKGSTAHRILSPVAAVLGAGGAAMASGEGVDEAVNFGLSNGMAAVFGHSLWRGGKDAVKAATRQRLGNGG